MVFIKNWHTRVICYIGLALCNVKNGCAFAWLFEMSGAKNKPFVTMTVNAFDRSSLFILGFTIVFISRWWVIIASIYITLGIISWLLIFFVLPESPMWLLCQDRKVECLNSLNWIARINGVEYRIPEDQEF